MKLVGGVDTARAFHVHVEKYHGLLDMVYSISIKSIGVIMGDKYINKKAPTLNLLLSE